MPGKKGRKGHVKEGVPNTSSSLRCLRRTDRDVVIVRQVSSAGEHCPHAPRPLGHREGMSDSER